MKTNTSLKRSLGMSLGVTGLFGSGSALAAVNPAPDLDFWFWLYHLPDAGLVALVIALFAGLSWLGRVAYRRLRGGQTQLGARSGYYAAFAGGVLGVAVALLAAGPWKAFLYDKITALPPTAAGPPALKFAGDLLTDADPEFAGRRPDLPPGALISRASRERHAGVNFDALKGGALSLNLFDDEPPLIAFRTFQEDSQDRLSWVGKIEGYEDDSEVILTVKGRTLAGTVSIDGRLFEIFYVNGRTHAVREIDVGQLPPDHPPGAPELDSDAEADTSTDSMTDTTLTVASTGQVIDALVVYTLNARTNAGGDSGMQSRILNAATAANLAYQNSKINMTLNIVYMGLMDYAETNAMLTTLSNFRGATDGYMDGVHALRDQYGADVVILISTDTDSCGYAYVIKSNAPGSAFGVVRDSCLTAGSFAHEIGHLQGNVHNPESTTSTGIYPDSYGHRVCGKFRDVMSYACSGEPRISYFSNPSVSTLVGGVDYPTGILGANDTARSMNVTASTVASFRTPATTEPTVPNAPGNLAATFTADSVTLTWIDVSNEAGYKVQRSLNGGVWADIAALGQNAASFSDTGLTAGAYSYRVQAYNSIGNSAYSNTVSATLVTVAPPPPTQTDTTAPVINISDPASGATVSGTASITASATDNVGVSGIKLYIDDAMVSASSVSSLTYSWNTKRASAGSHTIRVDAVDTSGNLGSTSLSVTVGASTTTGGGGKK